MTGAFYVGAVAVLASEANSVVGKNDERKKQGHVCDAAQDGGENAS